MLGQVSFRKYTPVSAESKRIHVKNLAADDDVDALAGEDDGLEFCFPNSTTKASFLK